MKHARHLTTRAAALALTITLAGCATQNDVTAPNAGTFVSPSKVPTTVLARSPVSQIGVTSSVVPFSPAVVVLDQNGAPMKDVDVHFVVTDGGGSVAPSLVSSNANGLAVASWHLGDTSGENTLTATVQGIQPVLFEANAVLPLNVTRWDLQLIGDKPLPLTYSGGGASWTITGGHYVLVDDGTYTFGYDVDGVERPSTIGRYIRLDSSRVQFYLPAGSYPQSEFYTERGGLFSTGIIQGNVMTVTYEDFVDFEIETYVTSQLKKEP